MRDPIILLVHLIATLARLMGPGGLRSVVAESVLVKPQLLILNRSRHRAPNLCASDRILAGVCALFMRPARVIRSAIVLRPSTILEFHRALRTRKYRWLFSPTRRRTGPQGPSKALVDAIVDMKRRNPRWGCPRIAQQIALAFAVDIDKDVVRRVLATHSRPAPHAGGPSWLTFLGHAKDSLWSIDLPFRMTSSRAAVRTSAPPGSDVGCWPPRSPPTERARKPWEEDMTTRLLTLRDVMHITALSRSTVYALMTESRFRKPIRIGSRAVRWFKQEVLDFIASRPRGGSERPAA